MLRFRPLRHRSLFVAGAVVATTLTIVGPASPAHALAGATLVITPSAFTSDAKNITSTCPAGTNVYGSGAKIIMSAGGGGDVLVTDLVPDATLTSVRAQGAENGGGVTDTWQILAYAICGPAVPNLQRVAAPSLFNGTSNSPRTATAVCPTGTSTYSVGFELDGASGEVFIDSFVPNSTLTQGTVGAYEDATFGPNWDLTAYAVCGDPVAGMSLQYASSGLTVDPSHEATTPDCPTGTTVTGIGGYLIGASGDNLMSRITPNPSMRAATVTGWENSPIAVTWGQDAYAICA